MTAIEQFISDAISGGFSVHPACDEYYKLDGKNIVCGVNTLYTVAIEKVLLSAFAWQAVGKIRRKKDTEWADTRNDIHLKQGHVCALCCGWRNKWQIFIDHLADGKSIEESLTAITN